MSGVSNFTKFDGLDGQNIDAYSRIRVSNPVSIFESQLQYDDQPFFWETVTTGGGTTAHLPDESSLELTCGTADGDSVTRQTFQYFRYQPGKSQLISFTALFGEPKTNVIKRAGYFDGYNGICFEQNGSDFCVVQVSSASGTKNEDIVQKSDWNLDKMDGSGLSGITLDPANVQACIIDLEWLGAGKVRLGFSIGGRIIYCHEYNNSNAFDTVFMGTANLPIRFEITNIGPTASNTTMKQICASVISEGGFEDKGIDTCAGNADTGVTVSSRVSLVTIRPKNLFNSIKNRGSILPLSVSVFAEDNPIFFEVVCKGTLGGTPSWTSVNDNSITEFSTDNETVTGGRVISCGYVAAAAGLNSSISKQLFEARNTLNSNIDGTAQDQLSVVAVNVSASATAYAALTFKERF